MIRNAVKSLTCWRFSPNGAGKRRHRRCSAQEVIRIPVDQLWNNWETRPKGVGKRMTVRSGSTAAKRRGCNGLTGIHMSSKNYAPARYGQRAINPTLTHQERRRAYRSERTPMTCKALRGSSTSPQERTPDLPLSLRPHNMERSLRNVMEWSAILISPCSLSIASVSKKKPEHHAPASLDFAP